MKGNHIALLIFAAVLIVFIAFIYSHNYSLIGISPGATNYQAAITVSYMENWGALFKTPRYAYFNSKAEANEFLRQMGFKGEQ